MVDFIAGLDEYFCENYANYDKLCLLPGYQMPKMQTSEVRDGRVYAYTLPANTMRLALQENKVDILAEFKKTYTDKTLSFSFIPLPFFSRVANKLSKNRFLHTFNQLVKRKNVDVARLEQETDILPEIWKKIKKGDFLPTKNTIFTIALLAPFSLKETQALLFSTGHEWDEKETKDVVVYYLLKEKIYNKTMVQKALEEYKVEYLFFAK